MKNKLIKNLSKFNYNFVEKESSVHIDMGTWQEVRVIFKDGKVIIEDQLKAWNILATFPMKIKTALFLNPLFVIIFVTIFINFEESFKYIGVLFAINILIITFSCYYLIRLEGIKTSINIWLNNEQNFID